MRIVRGKFQKPFFCFPSRCFSLFGMWRPVPFVCSPAMQQRECKGNKKNWSSLFPHVTFFLRFVKYAHFWASLAVGHVFSVSHKKRRQIKSLYLPSKRSLIGSFFSRTYKDCLGRSFPLDATNTKLRFYSVFVSIKKEWKQYCRWYIRGVRRRMKIRIQFLMCVSICAQLFPSHLRGGVQGWGERFLCSRKTYTPPLPLP